MRILRHIFLLAAPLLVLTAGPLCAQEWQPAPPMPSPRYDLAAVVIDGKIFVLGGLDKGGQALSSVLRYDANGGSEWTDAAPMDDARFDAAAVVLGGRIYVIGGADEEGEATDDVAAYDPAGDRWEDVADLDEGRRGHRAVVLDGRIHVVGGVDEDGKLVKEVEVYDPAEDAWSVSDAWQPGTPRVAFALVALGNEVYTIGGFSGGVPVPIANAEVFAGGSVSTFIPPGLLKQQGRFAAATVGETAYLLGGVDRQGRAVRDVVRFRPSAQKPPDRWREGPLMLTPRERFAAVSIDGRLYAIGGLDEREVELASMESVLISTAVEKPDEIARRLLTLEQNHPNPFTHSTTFSIVVEADRPERITVEIYDVLGRRIRTLADGVIQPGRHDLVWDGRRADGRSAASGTYLYVLQQNGRRMTRTMTLIR